MKKPLIVFAVIVAVLGALFVLKSHRQTMEQHQETAALNVEIFKAVFEPESVTDLVIKSPSESLELRKDQGVWKVTNLYGGMNADSGTVMNFLTSLKAVRGELRSNDRSLIQDYGLNEADAIHFIVKTEERTLEHILLGKKATGKRGNFLRRDGSSFVFAVPDDILTYMGFNPDANEQRLDRSQWLDKKVAAFDTAQIRRVQIAEGGKASVALVKPENGTWQFETGYGYGPDSEKVTNYLNMVNNLRAFAVAEPDEVAFDDNDWTLTLSEADAKKDVKIQKKVKEDGTFYLKVDGKSCLFKIAVYHFENLDKTDGGFFASNLLAVDAAKVRSLKLNNPLGKKKIEVVRGEDSPAVEGEPAKMTWKTPKGENVDTEKVTRLIDNLKSLSLKTSSSSRPVKGEEILAITLQQDKTAHELHVYNNASKDPAQACFAVNFNRDRNAYCLEEGNVRSLTSVVGELSKK